MSFTIKTDEGEVHITEENFHKFFFDVRTNKPQKGQVLAKFTAIADFVDGQGKKDIIYLLKLGKVNEAVKVMRKIHCVQESDCYKVLTEISKDLLRMKEKEVEKKAYEFTVQLFFYTQKEYVPNTPNWETIQLLEYNPETKTYKSRIEL